MLPDAITDFARQVLHTLYGLRGTVELLHGELDWNVAVEQGGQRYVLKIMRPACIEALVQMQCAAIDHLARTRPALPLPRVVPTVDGNAFGRADDAEGHSRLVWLQRRLPGEPLSAWSPVPHQTLASVGNALGDLVTGLAQFDHSACSRPLRWNLAEAAWIGEHLPLFDDPERRSIIDRVHARYRDDVAPRLVGLRQTVIHGDANTDNLLVDQAGGEPLTLSGIIDFGDMCRSPLVAEVAIACAYAMMGAQRPLAAAEAVVAGFHARCPLQPEEFPVLFPLVLTRLAVSVTVSALEKQRRPDDPYVTISEAPAWQLLELFAKADADLIQARLRLACGLPAAPGLENWQRRFNDLAVGAVPVLGTSTPVAEAPVIDCSFESTAGGDDPLAMDSAVLERYVDQVLSRSNADCVIGRYGEPRPLYTSPGFCDTRQPMTPRRTVHLGVDLFAAAGTTVHAPLDGTVVVCGYAPGVLDYGGYVILRHGAGDHAFDTVYGHLNPESISGLAAGDTVTAGTKFAVLGSPDSNGGWAPHLHFQVAALSRDWPVPDTPPGVSRPEDFAAMSALFPNPGPLLGVTPEKVAWQPPNAADKATRRQRGFAANLKLSYDNPFMPARGRRHHLFDAWGRVYLDAYNNVPHVGHCHPAVVEAAARQMRLLNTNTRYLHDNVLEYAECLSALMPAPLSVCFFLNSASEANELALRLARAHSGARDMLVMNHGYHGNTTGSLSISPYKFRHMDGPEDWVHVTPQPDVYR
ncbi:MAG: aminotransferase class III-fold pyridoxal phosphate-dependent enzyme, partial [Pseudomonadota bacterium]